MKNQYFGDIGDYSKFILMSHLIKSGLKIGLNWYLTQNDGRSDGKHIDYLNKDEYISSDSELCDFLRNSIINDRRNISEIRSFERFKNIGFYQELLDIDDLSPRTPFGRYERINRRKEWFNQSLSELSDRDVIFCDPDNGIATKSIRLTAKNSVKYVFHDEIEQMIDAGFSLVVYNHRDRSKEADYLDRLRSVYKGDKDIFIRVVRFNKYSVRDYIFLIQKNHLDSIQPCIDIIIKNKLKNYFNEIILK